MGAATLSCLTKEYTLSNNTNSIFFIQKCHRPWDAREVSTGINKYSRSSIHTQFQVLDRQINKDHLTHMRELVWDTIVALGLNPIYLTFHKDN